MRDYINLISIKKSSSLVMSNLWSLLANDLKLLLIVNINYDVELFSFILKYMYIDIIIIIFIKCLNHQNHHHHLMHMIITIMNGPLQVISHHWCNKQITISKWILQMTWFQWCLISNRLSTNNSQVQIFYQIVILLLFLLFNNQVMKRKLNSIRDLQLHPCSQSFKILTPSALTLLSYQISQDLKFLTNFLISFN